jgi:hypothetical protein
MSESGVKFWRANVGLVEGAKTKYISEMANLQKKLQKMQKHRPIKNTYLVKHLEKEIKLQKDINEINKEIKGIDKLISGYRNQEQKEIQKIALKNEKMQQKLRQKQERSQLREKNYYRGLAQDASKGKLTVETVKRRLAEKQYRENKKKSGMDVYKSFNKFGQQFIEQQQELARLGKINKFAKTNMRHQPVSHQLLARAFKNFDKSYSLFSIPH